MLRRSENEWIGKILSEAQDHLELLSDWEQSFVDTMTDRHERYGRSLRLSGPQRAAFEKIERKLWPNE